MNISDAARKAGLPAKTIRYYEEIGLVRPGRSANGYRAFSHTDLHKLNFLGRARALDFGIEDCRKLLALWENTDRASADVRRLATEHLTRIDDKIAQLEAMRETLGGLIRDCAGDARPDCPILRDLSGSTEEHPAPTVRE
ncbi:MAG: Cu(I)-responsive transcriptional regulator [Pseudomonadota bacterium]